MCLSTPSLFKQTNISKQNLRFQVHQDCNSNFAALQSNANSNLKPLFSAFAYYSSLSLGELTEHIESASLVKTASLAKTHAQQQTLTFLVILVWFSLKNHHQLIDKRERAKKCTVNTAQTTQTGWWSARQLTAHGPLRQGKFLHLGVISLATRFI